MSKRMRKITVDGDIFDPNKSGSGKDLPDGFYSVKINDDIQVKPDKNGNAGLAVKCQVTEPGAHEGWKTSIYFNLDSDSAMDLKKIKATVRSCGYDEGFEFDTEELAEMLAGKDAIINVKASKKTDPKTGQPYRANMVFATAEQREAGEGGAKEEKAPAAPAKKLSLAERIKAKK